jgi:mannose-1-phosphate guanylyltransferase
MVLLPMPEGEAYASVDVDEAFNVRRIAGVGPGGKKLSSWHFSGVHVMSPQVFDFMREDGAEDINREVYPRMLERGLPVRGHLVRASYWSDVGTPARCAAAARDLLFGQVPMGPFEGASPFESCPRGAGNYWAHETSRLGGARIAGPALFAEGSELGEGVRVGSAVSVGRRARVGRGAALNRVIVFDGAEVREGEQLEDCMVAPAASEAGRLVLPLPTGASAPARR